jgi:hypothetical protein
MKKKIQTIKYYKMKLSEIQIVQKIKQWCENGNNHCPNENEVSQFVREIIPYLEKLEERLDKLETDKSTIK